MVYPVLRFAEETLRRDEPTIGGLKIAQWISVALLLAGGGVVRVGVGCGGRLLGNQSEHGGG